MKSFLFFLLCIPILAFADEKPPVPLHLQVPDPIPPNFNKCVVVVWTEEEKKLVGKNGSFYQPPLTPQMIEDLRTIRREKMGEMYLCEMEDT